MDVDEGSLARVPRYGHVWVETLADTPGRCRVRAIGRVAAIAIRSHEYLQSQMGLVHSFEDAEALAQLIEDRVLELRRQGARLP